MWLDFCKNKGVKNGLTPMFFRKLGRKKWSEPFLILEKKLVENMLF